MTSPSEAFLLDANVLGVADPWLVARARVYGETVVTQEVSRPSKLSKVSLADVCDHFEVNHIEVVPFLRRAKAVFELRKG